MKKANIVPWMLSIAVPIGLAWSAGYVLSSMKKQVPVSSRQARTVRPQLAAPLIPGGAFSSPENAAKPMSDELQKPADRGVAVDAAQPLEVMSAVSVGGLTRTVKIYEEPLESTESPESPR